MLVVSLRGGVRRHYATFTLSAMVLTLGVQYLLTGIDSREDLSDQLWIIQPSLEVLLFGDAVISLAGRHERSTWRHQQAQARARQQEAAAAAPREAARLLHDHVLQAVAVLSARRAPVAGEQVRRASQEAVAAMTAHPDEPQSLLVDDLLAGNPVVERSGALLCGSSLPVPAAVAHSVAAAVHEALGNVAEHAAAEHVRVELAHDGASLQVAVVDDGSGFDVALRPVDRMGVGRSILQRMDDVGGQAEISSEPGRGTMVLLRWPRTEHEGVEIWERASTRTVRTALTRTAWPGLGAAVLMTLLVRPWVRQPSLVMAVALACLGIGVLAAAVLTRRALRPVEVGVLFLAAAVAWLTNLWAVPEQPELDCSLWLAWGSSSLVHLVVLSSRLREAWLMAAGWFVVLSVGLVLRYGDLWELGDRTFLLISGPGDVLLTLLVLLAARRTARQEARVARLASLEQAAMAHSMARAQLARFWSDRVTQEALPLLQELAAGRVDPSDPAVRRRADELEAVLREELVLGPQQPLLAAGLGSLREAGWQLTSTLSSEDQDEVLAAAHDMVSLLGAPARDGQRVTVSARAGRVTAVVLAASSEQLERWRIDAQVLGGGVVADPDFAWLQLGDGVGAARVGPVPRRAVPEDQPLAAIGP